MATMTPRRIEAYTETLVLLLSLVIVGWLAVQGVEIAQGALIGALGAGVGRLFRTTPGADDQPRARRATDALPPLRPPLNPPRE
jgi:hypothetical protein